MPRKKFEDSPEEVGMCLPQSDIDFVDQNQELLQKAWNIFAQNNHRNTDEDLANKNLEVSYAKRMTQCKGSTHTWVRVITRHKPRAIEEQPIVASIVVELKRLVSEK